MTGKKLDDKVTDAAMDELVTTGELNKSIDGDSQDIEILCVETLRPAPFLSSVMSTEESDLVPISLLLMYESRYLCSSSLFA